MHVSTTQMAPNLRLVTNIDDDVNWFCGIGAMEWQNKLVTKPLALHLQNGQA